MCWHGWHRLTYPNDLDVVEDLLTSDHAATVEDLGVGEALVWADWLDECQWVQWPRKQTLDYGSAPPIETALGSTPEHIETDVFDRFCVDYDLDVTLPDAGRVCLEHLIDIVAALDTEERYMLDYVSQADGPIDPKLAYKLVGGDPKSKHVYAKLRTLREANLVTKAGRGVYVYTLPDRVRSHLRFHQDVEQQHIAAIVERLESDFTGIAAAPEETDEPAPVSGDTLGTYRVHKNGTDGGYAQLGKPVTEYLGVAGDETVAVTPQPTQDSPRLVVTPGETTDGELRYSTFERKGYVSFTLTARGIAALNAAAGDSVRATAASEQTVHVAVAETVDQ